MSRFKKFISRPENAIFLMMTIMTLFVFITVILNIFYYNISMAETEGIKYLISKFGNEFMSFFEINVLTLIGLISYVFTTFLRLILIRKTEKRLLVYRIIASLYYLAAILFIGAAVLGVIFRFMEGGLPVLRTVMAVISAVFIVICMRKTFSEKLMEGKENENEISG